MPIIETFQWYTTYAGYTVGTGQPLVVPLLLLSVPTVLREKIYKRERRSREPRKRVLGSLQSQKYFCSTSLGTLANSVINAFSSMTYAVPSAEAISPVQHDSSSNLTCGQPFPAARSASGFAGSAVIARTFETLPPNTSAAANDAVCAATTSQSDERNPING